MNVTGIIAEYNPFHNGHLYHINEAKKLTGADYCIVVMSGDFVQRGEPAVMDKYLRARIALAAGADLVIELPLPYAASSAELFAQGAISILDKLGIVDSVCFGSECGDIDLLRRVADVLADEPKSFSDTIRTLVKQGTSYPAARNQALSEWFHQTCSESGLCAKLDTILSSPNNILGVEYLKAIIRRGSSIRPFTLRRDTDYNSAVLTFPHSSATAIRNALSQLSVHEAADGHSFQQSLKNIRAHVPDFAYEQMSKQNHHTFPICIDDFSSVLTYKLLSARNGSLSDYLDVSVDLEQCIKKKLTEVSTFSGFIREIKSKQYTYTRISRSLMHIILDIKKADIRYYEQYDWSSYARVLGFHAASAFIMSGIKKHGKIPLITKMADADQILPPSGQRMLAQEVFASNLYQSIVQYKYGTREKNEYTRGVIIL